MIEMINRKNINECIFINNHGDFTLENPCNTSYLYFPLANFRGLKSSITPCLYGDIKLNQNTFLLEPVTSESLHNIKSNRNFWIYTKEYGPWSVTGNSAKQISNKYNNEEHTLLKAGLLWHKIIRTNKTNKLQAEITNFVPYNDDTVELMQIKITNMDDNPIVITPIAAVPIYARSADNIRNHRHVTTLLNKIYTTKYGIQVKPTLSFNEEGHKKNNCIYSIYGSDEYGNHPIGFSPIQDEFIGEGGNLDWPEKVVLNQNNYLKSNQQCSGFNAIGAIKFEDTCLKSSESYSYIIALSISENNKNYEKNIKNKYLSSYKFNKHLEKTKLLWSKEINKIIIKTNDNYFNNWIKWVTLQPILRRIYGCSFLPHHDYGRGGKGWRDLWQDCLALLLLNPNDVKDLLFNNFAGIRIDGSNATIIGEKPGEFIADRNNISRVWMDHGVWPFLTTNLYINQSGDLSFLLKKQVYFKDAKIYRSRKIIKHWNENEGIIQKDINGKLYKGTILEHILIQHITEFFNVGENNNIRLEDADWNDGLDMAKEKGESVAFTALYALNMNELSKLMKQIQNILNINTIKIFEEAILLLDTISEPINYDSYLEKNNRLKKYFKKVENKISGKTIEIKIDNLIADLEKKAKWIYNHIYKNEIIKTSDHLWVNGYYDNDGKSLEGKFESDVRITLTGQVFPIMSGIVNRKESKIIAETVKYFLKDTKIGGYRLNTKFNNDYLKMGRAFGFAYGHKENGAMFSHMAVMYANALYKKDLAHEAWDVIKSIYNHCKNFDKSRIYPGIPEYINEQGRGVYHYLTGSASWLILTMITEVFGIKGELGNLIIEPKLLLEHFSKDGKCSITTQFQGKKINFQYYNQELLDYNEYYISEININNNIMKYQDKNKKIKIDNSILLSLLSNKINKIKIKLSKINNKII